MFVEPTAWPISNSHHQKHVIEPAEPAPPRRADAPGAVTVFALLTISEDAMKKGVLFGFRLVALSLTLISATELASGADQVVSVERAIAFFSDQLREHPDDAFARVIRAELWLDRDEPDEAMADCNEAIRINPKYGAAYETRADILLAREDVDQVIADCETALRLDSQSAAAHVRRGAAFL
jgi:tetratricopeptide (TPR) repeat protein